nr:c-type cytochrome domain-containing protein [Allorhodopirellula solitaria]
MMADVSTEPVKRMPIDDEGRVVDFERDVVPILRSHCLECHGADEAKNDFRVDDRELMLDYLIAEDAMSSTLFIDYMASEDDDMLMPPRSHGGPLSPAELALVRLWIDEGAAWPEDAMLDGSGAPLPAAEELTHENRGLLSRVWSFQGFLHPATIHFPIALLIIGAMFVVLGWKWPTLGTQMPLACLWIGAVSAVVATLMGWSFSVEKGYGSWARFDLDSEIFWHRWSAVVVTILSCIFSIVAFVWVKRPSPGLAKTWKVGLLLIAGLVAAVGHQGGELTYGKEFYPKAISILLGHPVKTEMESIEEPAEADAAADDVVSTS